MRHRQNGQHTSLARAYGGIVPFLTLFDDVIEGSPHPNPHGYQRPIIWCACGAKDLGAFVQTPEWWPSQTTPVQICLFVLID